jgi:glycosyltransferase involved in cell wall biosynthesis
MALSMKAESQPLVSVLTPVYNGEKYLSECIESVLEQTYSNWEYIIVNNRSTDRTSEIARAYASKDRRIRVHTNTKFVNFAANENIAFQQIALESKYCKMVHADDWLFPECIMKMVELAEVHPTVAIVGAYGLRNERVSWDGLPYPSTLISGKEICRNTLLGGPYVFGSPSSILIRSNEVRKRNPSFYNDKNPHCDIESCLDILRDNDFGFVHQVLTFTREHAEAESAFSNRFGTTYLGTLEHLRMYGRTYLNESEYQQCFERCLDKYYTFLASKALQKSEKGFWDFHRNTLRRLGYAINSKKLAKCLMFEVLNLVLNPLNTSKKIARKMSLLFAPKTKQKATHGIAGADSL